MENKNDINNIDLENINKIDMECNVYDDDDDFELKPSSITSISNSTSDYEDESRPLQSKTGIILNFNDTDECPMKTITADIDAKSNRININKNYHTENDSIDSDIDSDNINSIDMETDYYDDTEDDDFYQENKSQKFTIESENHINSYKSDKSTKTLLDFDEDPEYFKNELVSEEMLDENKRITQGQVESDYWSKMQKKHLKSNKPGSYNAHFHFAGNPELEKDMFNHDMMPNTSITNVGNSEGTSSSSAGSMHEDLDNISKQYSKGLKDIFNILGFEVMRNSDNSLVAIDTLDSIPDINAKDLDELIILLNPYIEDCFIYPLKASTGENFDTCKEWVDWFNSDNNSTKFKKDASDIKYCDILANHLHECVIS